MTSPSLLSAVWILRVTAGAHPVHAIPLPSACSNSFQDPDRHPRTLPPGQLSVRLPPARGAKSGRTAPSLNSQPHFRPCHVLWARRPHVGEPQPGKVRPTQKWVSTEGRRRGRAAGSPGLARAAGLMGQAGKGSAPPLPGREPGPGPTYPPLLVLLPIHDNHVPLGERQLVWVVGHTVVESFDPLGL